MRWLLLVLLAAKCRGFRHPVRLRGGWKAGRAKHVAAAVAPAPAPGLVARRLVASSAIFAAVMSFEAGVLASRGVPIAATAAVTGVVSAAACGALELCAAPRANAPAPAAPLCAQALLGGVMPHLAFFAIPRAGLAVANCLMFTMPLWSGIFGALCGAQWRRRDTLASLVAMGGVVLVADPFRWGATAQRGAFDAAGCAAALLFGVAGGLLTVLIQRSDGLSKTSPNVLTATQMLTCAALAVPALVLSPAAPGAAALLAANAAGLAAVGALMALQTGLRTRGLQLSPDPSVATLLYSEIFWCFLLDVAVLGLRPRPLQIVGALAVVASSFANAPH